MQKNSKNKRNGLIRVLGADGLPDSSRWLEVDALKSVAGGFVFAPPISKSTPKL